MTLKQALNQLQALGTPKVRAQNAKSGAGGVERDPSAAVFWVLPLGVVLCIAALVFRETALAGAGIACLGMSGILLWWWHRREHMPDRKAYWGSGEREAWPFLRRADWEHARSGIAPDRASTGSQSSRAEADPTSSPATFR
jgi:hypothetical protein